MDDDIRNRFRGVSRREPSGDGYERPARPVRPAPSQRPAAPSTRSEPAKPASAPKPEPAPAPKPSKKRRKKGKFSKKRLIIVLILLVVLAAGGFAGYTFWQQRKGDKKFEQEIKTPQETSQQQAPKATGTIRLIAIGDSMAFESINTAARQPDGSYNYLPMMSGFKPFF